MLNNFWKYLLYRKHFCGIEHTSKSSIEPIIISILKKSKKELNLDATYKVKSIEEVSKKLSKNQSAILIVNDKNTLSKTIENDQNDPQKLVYKAFPNINLEDFYFEVVSETKSSFISICRKRYVDELITTYSNKKINIIDFSLGNSLVSTIKSFVNEEHIRTSNAIIKIKNQQIAEIDKANFQPEVYNINGLKVFNQELLSFSGALQKVLNSDITITNYKDISDSLLTKFKHIQFFNQFLKFSGLLILAVLLINFYFFNHYFNQVNELRQISQINESTKQQIVALDESVTKKQKMVNDLLKSSGSKTSYFVNVIMHSLPETLLISEFNYQPLIKRVKTDKPIELNEDTIMMSGSSSDSNLFSKWINQLEQFPWIRKIEILNYGVASGRFSDFEIKISVRND
jgi:hypothetical protein